MRSHSILFLVLLAVGCASSGAPPADDTGPGRNVMIQFTDMSIQPSTATVPAGETVVWTNMSSEYNGVVSFPLGIESSFTCSELGPVFSPTAGRLVSMPVRLDSEDVITPCPLKPGEYEYQIDLFTGVTGGGFEGFENSQRTLNGKLVVE